MSFKIFYSWQSDLPNNTNRAFVNQALENAAKIIRADDSIQVEPVVDRDTAGVPGSPDIASTIFTKIEQAQMFVCDVSIINQNQGSSSRFVPNPNVLLELGYALKALGSERIVMVMNTAFGGPELLPFDLRMRRVVTYSAPQESTERADERKKLSRVLEDAIRVVLSGLSAQKTGEIVNPSTLGEQAKAAIENSRPDQAFKVRKFMEWLVSQLDSLAPNFSESSPLDDALIQALEQTPNLVIEFAQLVEVIAILNATEAASGVYKGFEGIVKGYDLRTVPSKGNYYTVDFDFHKFMGHELFVTFFTFLIREGRWEMIAELLEEKFIIDDLRSARTKTVDFEYVSQHVQLLDDRAQRLNINTYSLHAQLLNERHITGELAKFVPMQEFMDADYLLALRSELRPADPDRWQAWAPWSTLYMRHQMPRYLIDATKKKFAERLLGALGVQSIPILRQRLTERKSKLRRQFAQSPMYNPVASLEPEKIGTE